ncbi:hypothetical protein DLAC_01689 [Tieghemostelium lacteum]|uniref:Vesicle transport v-SNARE N-terminal domain-containing protein n=1 Tax=Tieghemostelium lacteum TaxID=361077 RepID=A0A152A635_TIELA|nr:hypothetical protein DLAC_01689 [Tieghemostelium lacteum]|eukprot:KYR01683.1 hypothetical protein DLAC_01689 [Tieghemostelium lacteum]
MQHVFSHYENDLNDLSKSVQSKLYKLSEQFQTLSHDEKILLIDQITEGIEESQEIVQQLEFSAQNSGNISEVRPKINNYNTQISNFTNQLEQLSGNSMDKRKTKEHKISFENVIQNKDDLDQYQEEEDLNDLREDERYQSKMTTKQQFFKFMKNHSLKIIVVFIVSMTISLVAYYIYNRDNNKSPNPVH